MTFTPRSLEDLQHEFPPDISYLSATGMKTALRCAEQYRRIYIKGQRKAPSLALVAGRADHKAIETSMAQKITTGVDLPVGEVENAFIETIERTVEEVGGLAELEDKPTTPEWDQVRTVGLDGVAKYHRNVSPRVQPLAVEEEFELQLPGVPVPLTGYIDLVASDGLYERIIDRKRSGRAPSAPAPDWRFQGGLYQLHRRVPHEWHVTVAPKRGLSATLLCGDARFFQEPLDEGVMARQVAGIAAQIGFLYQRYGPDEEWPATGVTHPFACNYCGFRPECWYWKGEK